MNLVLPASVLDSALDGIGGFLPNLAGAIVVLVIGLIAARIVTKVVRKILQTAGIDKMGERWGVHDALGRVGLGSSLSGLIAGLVRFLLLFVVIVLAVSILGLPALDEALNEAILFLPRLVVGLAILMLAVVAGNTVREKVDRIAQQMDLHGPLGLAAQIAVIGVGTIVAVAMMGIPTLFLVLLATTLVAGVALTAALAFGLGSRDVVGQLAAGRYLSEAIQPGRLVKVGDIEGEVIATEGAATTIRTGEGELTRVPNRMLLDAVVVVREPPPPAAPTVEDAPTQTM
jgi:small-conductance mechanosensitive channel